MARKNRRDEVTAGLMGALLGGLQYKLNDQTRIQLEEAEARKEQRLAAIRAAEIEGAQQHQTMLAQKQMDHQTALADKQIDAQTARDETQGEQRLREIGAQGANQMAAIEAQGAQQERLADLNNAAALERTKEQNSGRRAIIGSDGNTYMFGEELPDGVTPMGGFGTSWAPPASRQGAGLMGGAQPGKGAGSARKPLEGSGWSGGTPIKP